MKKILLAVSTVAALVMAGTTYAVPAPDGATVTVRGMVTGGTCDVKVNNGAEIGLEDAEKVDFTANNTIVKEQSFNIDILNCAAGTVGDNITFIQDSTLVDISTGYLLNKQGTGGAKGVEVALKNGSTVLKLNTVQSIDYTLDATTLSAQIPLKVGYISSDITAIATGPVLSRVQFMVNYS